MKKYYSLILIFTALFFNSCSNGQPKSNNTNLDASAFAAKIKELPSSAIVDVRTAKEFSTGHIQNAKNIDWNGDDFDTKIAALDKSTPVFVYCLSGGRSSSAAEKMRADGFKTVYELDGGMMKWRAANLPETNTNIAKTAGMSKQQFESLINSDKIVLVDFYAEWCPPCKKMKPYLDEISKDMADKVVVIRIDADNNQTICKELKIDALPVLKIYTAHKLTWTNTGYIDKEGVVKQLQ